MRYQSNRTREITTPSRQNQLTRNKFPDKSLRNKPMKITDVDYRKHLKIRY